MEVTVLLVGGGIEFTLKNLKASLTILQLKELIQSFKNYSIDQQILMCNEVVLPDTKIISTLQSIDSAISPERTNKNTMQKEVELALSSDKVKLCVRERNIKGQETLLDTFSSA